MNKGHTLEMPTLRFYLPDGCLLLEVARSSGIRLNILTLNLGNMTALLVAFGDLLMSEHLDQSSRTLELERHLENV